MSYHLDLRHVRYFHAVAETLNFRKAADRLYISQPGLSRQIRQLEEGLGVTLFIRSNRKVTLSAAGSFLFANSQPLFDQIELLKRQVKLVEKGEAGELRIGFLGSAMQQVLPNFLRRLKEGYPKVNTTLNEMNNRDQVNLIERGELDLGFVRLAEVSSSMMLHPVMQDSFSLVLPKSHWLSEKNFQNINQLNQESFILFSSDYSPLYYDKIMSIFRDSGFEPKVSHRTVHALTIFKLVESELGVAVIPTSLKQGFDLNVKFIELKQIPQRTTLSMVWSKTNVNPILRHAIRFLTEEYQR